MKKGVWVVLITALMLSRSTPGLSQPYRDNLPLPAFEIYKNMLAFALDKNFEKVELSLQMIRPISQALNSKFKVDIDADIRNGLAKKDQERVIKAIQRLILLDMKDMMLLGAKGAEESQDKARPKFKGAFLDYLLLSPYITVKSFSSDQKIKNRFQRGTATAAGAEDFRRTSEEIERELLMVMPELK